MTIVAEEPSNRDNAAAAAEPLPVYRGLPRRIGPAQRALAALASGCNALLGPRGADGLGILMYHRVVEPPEGFPRPTWNVPPARLEQQLAGLLRRSWQPFALRSVLDRQAEGLSLPRKAFVVTFDDGYENNLLYALPVLRKLGIPATIFLATAYLDTDQPFPSDDWSAAGDPGVPAETWRPLTTEQCHELAASGLIELAAHTHTHADFRSHPAELITDLQTCCRELRDRFGIERPTFAFPYGTKADGFASPALASAARQAGVQCSLTTEPQLVGKTDDSFDWGRFAAEEHDTAATLAGKLGGWHSLLRSMARKALGK